MSLVNSTNWIGIVHSTMPKYLKKLVDTTMRDRLLLAMVQSRGRVKLNCSGDYLQWPVFYSLPEMETYNDGGIVNFGNHNPNLSLAVNWRGYIVQDSISQMQNAMNSGDTAIVNLFQQKQNNIKQSIREKFCAELYGDGDASDAGMRIHGLESFLSYDDSLTDAGDTIAYPNDTFGLTSESTTPQDHGGYWSAGGTSPNHTLASDWPDGQGTSEYDCLSPKLVNWSSNAWGTSSTAWEANAWRVTDAMIDWLSYTGGKEAKPDVIVYSNDMFRGYKNAQESKTRINIPHKESQDLGFSDTLNHNGVAIDKDFDCPMNTGYAINVDKMELCSLFPQLFWYEGPDKDPHSAWSYLFATGFYGNCTWQPKFFGKTFNFS